MGLEKGKEDGCGEEPAAMGPGLTEVCPDPYKSAGSLLSEGEEGPAETYMPSCLPEMSRLPYERAPEAHRGGDAEA